MALATGVSADHMEVTVGGGQPIPVQLGPTIDPMRGQNTILQLVSNATAVGILCIVMVYQTIRDGARQDAVRGEQQKMMEYVVDRLDKREERQDKRDERAQAHQEKRDDTMLARMGEWNKSINDRNGIEQEKTRTELKLLASDFKALNDQMKLMGDRFRMMQSKE